MAFRPDLDVLRSAAAAAERENPRLLDGRAIAAALRGEVRRAVELLHDAGIEPRLDVVLVGDDPASQIYVRYKVKACAEVGIESRKHLLGADVSQDELEHLLTDLSANPEVYGLLLQLPIPERLETMGAIDCIAADRDVDGFHVVNLGRLMSWRGAIEACTPRGVMTLLRSYEVPLEGQHAVVVGRSIGVGRPMAQMLVRANATVTVCHRHTRDLAEEVGRADVLVVATGVPHLVKGSWIKEGATVVDVGITRTSEGLKGDVEFDVAAERASRITPVPRGVGPMTVATLLENTVRATCERHDIEIDATGLRRMENR